MLVVSGKSSLMYKVWVNQCNFWNRVRVHQWKSYSWVPVNQGTKYKSSKGQTDTVLLDFSKAFDVVPHQRLVMKLNCYGIRDNTLCWIQSFLSGQTQRVAVEGELSDIDSHLRCSRGFGPVANLVLHIYKWYWWKHHRSCEAFCRQHYTVSDDMIKNCHKTLTKWLGHTRKMGKNLAYEFQCIQMSCTHYHQQEISCKTWIHATWPKIRKCQISQISWYRNIRNTELKWSCLCDSQESKSNKCVHT